MVQTLRSISSLPSSHYNDPMNRNVSILYRIERLFRGPGHAQSVRARLFRRYPVLAAGEGNGSGRRDENSIENRACWAYNHNAGFARQS